MFFSDIRGVLANAGVPAIDFRSYVPFASYPIRDYMRLIAESAAALHPELPLRDAMRRLGLHVYPTFASTMVGRAIFSVAGRDFAKVANLARRAYDVSVAPGEVSTELLAPKHVRVTLNDLWPFPDAYQLGVWEGAMRVCDADGEILVRVRSESEVDYDIRWT